MTDAHDEGGDPACWLHLFEDEPEAGEGPPHGPAAGADEVPIEDASEG